MNKNELFLDPDKLIDKDNISAKKIICSLCKGIINEPVELFCEHIFCSRCLNTWSEKLNNKCPLCNKLIYKKPSISEENKLIFSLLKFSDNNKVFTYQEYILSLIHI